MALVISPSVRRKLLAKHDVKEDEILQCFANRESVFLEDSREEHRTNPATKWFIAETDYGRKLKVVFVPENGNIVIKTAYLANSKELQIYEKHALKL